MITFGELYMVLDHIYSWLTRTSSPCLYCTKLVSKVVSCTSSSTSLLTYLSRCTAPADGLDDEKCGRHFHEHTDLLVEEFELGALWDEYGIVGDVVVSAIPSYYLVATLWKVAYSLVWFTAIYQLFPLSRHPWAAITWHSTSADQGSIQRSYSDLGAWLHKSTVCGFPS